MNNEEESVRKYNLIAEKITETWNQKLLKADFYSLKYEAIRKRIVLEQKGKCKKCFIDEWFGKKISLEIDHIDGNNKNNSRDNLEGLCPNCHSITSTWRGRNKTKRVQVLKVEDYINAYYKTKNIRQALLSLGIAGKGGNYKRINGILRQAGIID